MQDEDGLGDEITLLRQAAGGDDEAFERLVARHEASVHRFIRTLTSDVSAVEEALQETFVAAWRGAGTFRGDSSVRTWLFTIARHAVQRQFRRPAGSPSRDDMTTLDELGIQAGWGAQDPEAAAIERERREVLTRALDALDPEDRRVLVLRDLEQVSGEEAAAALGLTVAALKSRLHRARLRFAARLRQEVAGGI